MEKLVTEIEVLKAEISLITDMLTWKLYELSLQSLS
jgi:hypothetical protein